MKAEVVRDFYDLETGLGCVPENTYHVGDTFEGTAARVNGLVEKGFVKKPAPRKKAGKSKDKE